MQRYVDEFQETTKRDAPYICFQSKIYLHNIIVIHKTRNKS